MKPALTNKILYIAAAIGVGYLLGVDSSAPTMRANPIAPKPDDVTCRPIDGWTSQIEKSGSGGWACVMRSNDGRSTKAFFYGDVK